jgi:DNA invertase Pin-like site-specific DNA recombinase
MMMETIKDTHTERNALIYIRQSTTSQLRFHQESTDRQYKFRQRALQLGWATDKIDILDQDLGISGKEMANRPDFKKLVAEVSMGRVGAVFALEASRLSRSCADWHRLLELCALTASLIVDEDGVYDPTNFNDQLLLGLKGTMSQAELHFMRARLWGGKLNKAKKGELHFPLPVGLIYDSEGRTVLDPDQEVQGALRLFFRYFMECGSAYGVVHRFAREQFRFPKRAYGGTWDGKLIWGFLDDGRALNILKNPAYAGCYAFGRHRQQKTISDDGSVTAKTVLLPEEEWLVCIRDHHKGYISWEEFMENRRMLSRNRTNSNAMMLPGAAREGHTLLQGLLVCGVCGHRISVRYKGNGGIYPMYECNGLRGNGQATRSCISFRGDVVDGPVAQKALELIQGAKLQIAVKAIEQLEERRAASENQWQRRLERIRYESALAQRRYEQVDPDNRLVATTLESQWNEALKRQKEVLAQYNEWQKKECPQINQETRQRLLDLAEDLPRVWKNKQTPTRERKQILRLIIKDITVEKLPEKRQLLLHIRWQGGTREDLAVDLVRPIHERIRYGSEVLSMVSSYAEELEDDNQIAEALNSQGKSSATGKRFTASMVKWIRYNHRIRCPSARRSGELTVKETALKFGVSTGTVYYWIQRGIIHPRKSNSGAICWITLNSKKENELKIRAEKSRSKWSKYKSIL